MLCTYSRRLSEKGSRICSRFPRLLYLAQGSPGGVVPDRWSNLLLSDRDERNETVGTARDGLRLFFLSVQFLPGCQE